MPFLPPNQQRQSIKGISTEINGLIAVYNKVADVVGVVVVDIVI